jgi:hypothetical protein
MNKRILLPIPGCKLVWNRDGIQFKEEEKKNGLMLYLLEKLIRYPE